MRPEIKNILYVTDLSRNSAYAFRYAMCFLESFGAKIKILTVVKEFEAVTAVPIVTQMGEDGYKKAKEETLRNILKRLQKRLEFYGQKELTEEERKKAQGMITIVVKEGDPSVKILEAVEADDVDMVIMGANSKEVLKYTFLGGVTQRVLRHIRKPVLVVPIPRKEFELSFREDDTL